MKYLFILFIAFCVLFNSCSKDSTIEPPVNSGSGVLALKIDRQNAPQDVQIVIATLTRSGFQTLTASMNLTSDSSAQTAFMQVSVGTWHLKVNAYDTNNIITYTGETDVIVSSGVTTNISLQLMFTGNQYGDINIIVTWPNSNIEGWKDYFNNPILVSSNGSYDHGGVLESVVIQENESYKMWYTGLGNSGLSHIMYAESSDGLTWYKPQNLPVLYPGLGWDSWAVFPGPILKEGNLYKMYYTGGAGVSELWHAGLATSIDGKNWVKNSLPVLQGNINSWDPQVIPWSCIKKDGVYFLYYTGRLYPQYKIGLATSTDGINWTKQPNPILTPTKSWEGIGVAYPSVILEDGVFKMVYSNVNPTYNAFGFATSIDGINWTKDEQPFFRSNQTHNQWSAYKIAYPCFNIYDGQKRIYYTGEANSSKIGVVQYR
jgi:predicted GH43/DUF377 family glycosyl hydrolase